MSKVLQLRSERAELNTKLQALAKIEADGGSLNAEQLEEFTSLEAQIADLSSKLARAEAAEKAAALSAVPVNEGAQGVQGPPASRMGGGEGKEQVKGAGMAQMVRLLAAAQGNQQLAAHLAKEGNFGSDVQMALSTVTAGAGGVLVPTNMASEVIEALRPTSIVRKMGVISLPLNNGNLTMPRISGNTVVGYIGTETDIPLTGMTFADTKLSAKKMAALVPVSNDLLRMSGVNPRVDQLVANDLATSMGLSEDLHFIRADGTGVLPKGLRYWAIAQNLVPAPAMAGIELQAIDLYLGGMMLRLETANVQMQSCGWLMHPRVLRWLQSLRDGNGNKAYPEIEQGLLKGYPVGLSNQIPVNLGAGSNQTEIYFVNFADMMIGEDMDLVIDFSKEATYKDGGGEVVSAFQRDQTLVRVIAKHDFGPRHVESIVVGTACDWGAGM
ncbi:MULTISPECIES: phage major capsid protein [unclassified Pseudomonas]|uniref:phage major capsid protein n=1 Tax=unclassified Pseudomonas TaxID=196821 RepID=UPI002448A248|nr:MULTISPECIES: phage major capsid protein [unclassified Pseudomonas]MDG9925441.1 phage major capsid protein [Pseudomonas sp. GD04045]MDH0034118.1 phage major capsid protein [Pseudomonas sp. GD04019]